MAPEQAAAKRDIDWGKVMEMALTAPGDLGSTYSAVPGLHQYSYLNMVYLQMQGAEGLVATLKRWNALGRTVLKGSKAYEIVRPIFARPKEGEEEAEPQLIGYKPVRCIFTYSQTKGDELPPPVIPEWNLELALEKLGIKRVPFRRSDSTIQGYAYDRNVAINPFAKFPLKTTIHEAAHIALGHTLPDQLAEYERHRGIKEFEAEGSSHLVMNELQMMTEEQASISRAYIQGWLRGERPPEKSIKQVFHTVDVILKAGRLAISPPDDI
jgi:hypothetical protein